MPDHEAKLAVMRRDIDEMKLCQRDQETRIRSIEKTIWQAVGALVLIHVVTVVLIEMHK